MAGVVDTYQINPDDFNLTAADFDNQSKLHGVGHVYRVMYHCLKLGTILGNERDARLAFIAAFLHDLARKHDGKCTEHGKWSAEYKMPLYDSLLIKYGVGESEREIIKTAITYHSRPEELEISNPSWATTAILKDADALDRIRLGEYDLNPRYLRFEVSRKRIQFAKNLYYTSLKQPFKDLSEIISIAELLEMVPTL